MSPRSTAARAADYCGLKRRLAKRFRDQRESYTESKTRFIREVEAKASAQLREG